MDSSRNFRNGSELPAKSRRSHRGKIKSSVNMRLNPEFDLRSLSGQGRDDDELDPRTMDFDTLAKLLHPTFIMEYFCKILYFLKSDEVKLRFPDLAPYKEAFLVKVATDNIHLTSRVLNDASASLGCNILEVVLKNKKKFKWVHAYEYDTAQKNSGMILVYKKMDITKIQNEKPHSSPTSPVSLASSLEDMSLTSQSRQAVTPGFRISMLNTTLKFIRDNTQLKLEYPEMLPIQAQFIHSLISPHNTDVGLGFKSIYGPLSEALLEIEKKFELKKVLMPTGSDYVKIWLEKVPLNEYSDGRGDQVSSEHNTSSTTSNKQLSKAQRDCLNKEKMLSCISGSFIYQALKQMVDFYDDPASASVEFNDISDDESRFVESIISISRSTEYYKLFDERCVVLLKIIARHCRSHKNKVKMTVGKLCRQSGFRNVSFQKTPSYDSVPSRMTSRQHLDPSPRRKQNGGNTQELQNLTSIEITRHYDTAPERVKTRSRSRENRSRRIPAIAFQSAGSQLDGTPSPSTDSSGDVGVETINNKDKNKKCPGRNNKLIKALSKPIESGIAEKMMRRMGWDGGALGVRGEGITEPIMPALHLEPGAGLGHVKVDQTVKQTVKGQTNVKQLVRGEGITEPIMPALHLGPGAGFGHVKVDQTVKQTVKGVRGDGITEPIMPALHLEPGAGLGHVKVDQTVKQTVKGVRGEGITEPIMPALHLEPGAGLSHVKVDQTFKPTNGVKVHFLSSVLSLLLSASSHTSVSFTQRLSKREGRFVIATTDALNDRQKIGLARPEEIYFVESIRNILRKDLKLFVDSKLEDGRRTLQLTKTNIHPALMKKNVETPKNDTTTSTGTDQNSDELSNIINDVRNPCISKKAAGGLAYRILFMEKIKEFLQKECTHQMFVFDWVINKRQIKFFLGIIYGVNEKVSLCEVLKPNERDVYKALWKLAADCHLSADFSGKTVIIRKKHCVKRFTNSALDLPPPKSLDTKNTIIYTPTGIIRPDGTECDNSDITGGRNGIAGDENDLADDENGIAGIITGKAGDENGIADDKNGIAGIVTGKAGDENRIADDKNGKAGILTGKTGDENAIGGIITSKAGDKNGIAGDENGITDKENGIGGIITSKAGDKTGIAGIITGKASDENGITDDENGVASDQTDFTQDKNSDTANFVKADDDDDELLITDEDMILLSDDECDMSVDKTQDDDNREKLNQTYDDVEIFETDVEQTKNDISIDIRSESLLLGILVRDNKKSVSSVKKENLDSSFEATLNDFTETCLKNEVNNNLSDSCNNRVKSEVKWEVNEDANTNSSKRCLSDTISYGSHKKPKSEVTYVSIVSKTNRESDINLVKQVQTMISNVLKEKTFLPLLKCHGVYNGGLIYSCHDDTSCDWLRQIVSVASLEINPTDYRETFKFVMKIGSFIPISTDEVLSKLKAYYPNLDVDSWVVSNVQVSPNYVTCSVLLDENSFKFISERNFSLFAGIDAVEFNRCWN